MKVEVSTDFKKIYQKRFSSFSKLKAKFEERTRLFSQNQSNPLLKDHPLKGDKQNFRSFSITGDIRVVYQIINDTAYFLDIGTHNQVY